MTVVAQGLVVFVAKAWAGVTTGTPLRSGLAA